MSERDEKRGGAGCAITGVVLFLLPVLYVLGLGPAALLAKHYPATEYSLGILYFPLIALAQSWTPVESVLMWYTKLWIG